MSSQKRQFKLQYIQYQYINYINTIPYKQGVTGSNPVSPTTLRKPSTTVGGFFIGPKLR